MLLAAASADCQLHPPQTVLLSIIVTVTMCSLGVLRMQWIPGYILSSAYQLPHYHDKIMLTHNVTTSIQNLARLIDRATYNSKLEVCSNIFWSSELTKMVKQFSVRLWTLIAVIYVLKRRTPRRIRLLPLLSH